MAGKTGTNEIFRTKAPIKLEKFQALINLYRDDLEPDAELRYYNGAFIVEKPSTA